MSVTLYAYQRHRIYCGEVGECACIPAFLLLASLACRLSVCLLFSPTFSHIEFSALLVAFLLLRLPVHMPASLPFNLRSSHFNILYHCLFWCFQFFSPFLTPCPSIWFPHILVSCVTVCMIGFWTLHLPASLSACLSPWLSVRLATSQIKFCRSVSQIDFLFFT